MGRTCTASAAARSWAAAALALATVGLAGCGGPSDEAGEPLRCPPAAIVADLSVMTRFGGPTASQDEQAFYGEITSASTECDYSEDEVAVTVSVNAVYDRPLDRPASNEPVEFFVAVARPDGTVIGKEMFATTVEFRDGEVRAGYREDVDIVLPLPGGAATGPGFIIYVGFQLSPAELEYNRQLLQ